MSAADLLAVLLADTDWQKDAACRPGDGGDSSSLFLPSGPDARRYGQKRTADFAAAQRICEACCVRPQCAAFAARHDIRFGVWGGQLLGSGITSNKNTSKWKPLRKRT